MLTRSTSATFHSLALAFALAVGGAAAEAGAQTLPGGSPQSAGLASGIEKAFAAALTAAPAGAQTTAMGSDADADWKVGLYPIYVWIPFGIGIDVTVPPGDNGEGGGSGSIVDGRFDGAYFGGFYASKGRFRVDADGVWAGFGGDRPERPYLKVDANIVYFHATGGVRLVKDLYATAGVRRLAMKYDIDLANFPRFERKPGVWDPVVGVAWHTEGDRRVEFHAVFEGGGFGVGTDSEVSGSARLDLKPWTHFGITAGYAFLHFRLEDTVRNRTFEVKQTLHGPLIGIGLYF